MQDLYNLAFPNMFQNDYFREVINLENNYDSEGERNRNTTSMAFDTKSKPQKDVGELI